MGKKKDKKERRRQEREAADVERLEAEARAQPVADADPGADPLFVPALAPAPSEPVALEPSGPFPGVTPPAVLRRAPARAIPGAPEGSPGLPVVLAARDVVARLSGASLCYGEPVTVGGHTVIPVGKVRAHGGMGFGSGTDPEAAAGGSGGGGGGMLKASPLGFIDVTADGVRFTPIDSGGDAKPGRRTGSGLALLAGAAAGIAGAALAARRGSRRTGLSRLKPR